MAYAITLDSLRTLLIPLSDPETAPELLQIGATLVGPQGGRLIALFISQDETEDEAALVDAIKPLIESLKEEGHPVDFLSRVSTGIGRGVLDAALEFRADAILAELPTARAKNGKHSDPVGPVIEGIMSAAPCDVLLYRPKRSGDYKNIMIALNGGLRARAAALVGARLAKHTLRDAEAIFVVTDQDYERAADSAVDRVLSALPETRDLKSTIVKAEDNALGFLARISEDDLAVIGLSEHRNLEAGWLPDFARVVLDNAPGAILLTTSMKRVSTAPWQRGIRKSIAWARPLLTNLERGDILRQSAESSALSLDYMVLIVIAAMIASLGLLLNSGAVIIGAMLIAPLMQPLLAIGGGLTAAEFRIVWRGVITLAVGMLTTLALAFLIGLLNAGSSITPEMLGRGSPSLPDVFVALASGLIAAYGMARKDIPSAVAGVAIAAALIPPWCTVGLALALGDMQLARGAALLFAVNILSIIFAASSGFGWLGMRQRLDVPKWARSASFVAVALLAALALQQIVSLNQELGRQGRVREVVAEILEPATIIDIEAVRDEEDTFLITVRSEEPVPMQTYQMAVVAARQALDAPVELRFIPQEIIRLP
jgi:uncharacterized hydrophobic protein (TIGR00271 family)